MKIRKAVITAAGRAQRAIPMQTIVAQDGTPKSVLTILADEAASAGIEDICVVTAPGDEARYADAVGPHACRLHFVAQPEPLGYGHAIRCAGPFTAAEPFLHLVGDHIYVSASGPGCARALVSVAESEGCSVSAVQSTRESLLPYFGAVSARRITGSPGVYRVDKVIEKPTPTEAEQKLLVPGLRAGHYLCFFGMHVLTPLVMEILGRQIDAAANPREVTLSGALDELGRHEQYLAFENASRRFDIGSPYGLMFAQMALALSSQNRDEVLYRVLELVADR